MKPYHIIVILLMILSIGIIDASFVPGEFSKSQRIDIRENMGMDVVNYSVNISIYKTAEMRSDFGDIRFVDSTKTNELGYYIDDMKQDISANIYVLINLTANKNTTIYMYYGNSTKTTTGSIKNAFLFGDDFSTNSISRYSVGGNCSSVLITNGELNMTGGEGGAKGPCVIGPTIQPINVNYTVEANFTYYLATTYGGVTGFMPIANPSREGYAVQINPLGAIGSFDIEKLFIASLNDTSKNHKVKQYEYVEGIFLKGNITGTWKNATDTRELTTNDATYSSGYYGMKAFKGNISMDWFRVKPYLKILPTIYKELIDITENSQSYNLITFEGNTENFILNVTIPNNTVISEANLYYNNTKYQTGNIVYESPTTAIISREVVVPGISAAINISFSWNIILSTGSSFNTSSRNQSVLILAIDDCTVNSILLLNYTLVDEKTQQFFNATLQNASIQVSTNIYSINRDTLIMNYSKIYQNRSDAIVCLSNNLAGTKYSMDVTTKYGADLYSTEYHNIQNMTLTNSTISNNITLYDLLTSESTRFKIYFKDRDFLYVPDALINVQREYVSEGKFKSVEIPITDINGLTTASLVKDNVVYTIIVSKYGEILAIFNKVVAVCNNELTGDCEITLQQELSSEPPTEFSTYQNINYLFSFDKTLRRITLVFSTIDGTPETVFINTTKSDMFYNTTVCQDTLTSSSGTLTCTIPESYGNITVYSELYVNNNFVTYKLYDLLEQPSDYFEGVRGILLIVLMFTIIIIMTGNPILTIVGVFIGFIISTLLFLFSGGSLIGPASAFIWLLIAGGIVIYKIAKVSG